MHALKSSTRIFAVAVVSLVAMMAIAASPAFGSEGFTAAEYPVEFLGEKEGSEGQVFTAEGGLSVKCKLTTLTGMLEEGVEELEVTPTYDECSAKESSAKVTTTGCTYKLHANTKKIDIVCSEGKTIKVLALSETCEFTIGTQSNVGSVEYVENEEAKPTTISLKAKLKEIKYTKTKDSGSCPFSGMGEKSDGTLTGDTLLKAVNFEKVQKNLLIAALFPPTLCKANQDPCKAPYDLTKTKLEANASVEQPLKYTLAGSAETVKCIEVTISGSTTNKGAGSILSDITTFGFNKCSTALWSSCSIKANGLPYKSHFYAEAGKPGNGDFQMFRAGKPANVSLTVECNKIPCTYEAGALNSPITGGAPANMTGLKASMVGVKANDAKCGPTLTFDSTTYKFDTPLDDSKVAQMFITQ